MYACVCYKFMLHFAWADQKDKVYLILHKVAREKYTFVKYKVQLRIFANYCCYIGVKFLPNCHNSNETKFIAYAVKWHFAWCTTLACYGCTTKVSWYYNPGAFELRTFVF